MSSKIEKVWVTQAGLRAVCLIVDQSWRCGYVEVPPDHPLHAIGYGTPAEVLQSKVPEVVFDVHGGLTYSGAGTNYPITDNPESEGWWFGFDCAHYGDAYIEGSPRARKAFREGVVRTKKYVVEECENLAKQLKEVQK